MTNITILTIYIYIFTSAVNFKLVCSRNLKILNLLYILENFKSLNNIYK